MAHLCLGRDALPFLCRWLTLLLFGCLLFCLRLLMLGGKLLLLLLLGLSLCHCCGLLLFVLGSGLEP